MSGRRFVWFAPNAGIDVAYRMEHRAANALADSGNDVVMVQCDRVLASYCQVMSPAGLTATSPTRDKEAICRECRFAAGLAREHARYRVVQLSEFLTDTDFTWANQQVAKTRFDSWDSFEIDGMPVGRYASYTTMLHHKRATVTQTPEAWAEYLADLRGALLVALAAPRIAAYVKPTHAVVYNALYPANRVFAEGMKAQGAILLNISGGPTVPRRFSTLAIYDGIKASQTMTDSEAFRLSMEVPVTELEVWTVEDHIAQLMSGADPWVYSSAASSKPARAVRFGLGVRPLAAIVTVIVSSPDETRSNLMVDAEYHRDPLNGYSDTAEFLASTIELARARPEVDFVFRLHPRLAPNKRERLASPDLEAIYDLLADLPVNAVVNHPGDGVSLYDLVLISSAAINHTSSAGLEFLVFGVPVVQFDAVRAGIYPASLSLIAPRHSAVGFSAALDRALEEGFDLGRTVKAFRWYASMQVRAVVHLDPLNVVDPSRGVRDATVTPVPASRHPLGRFLPGPVKEYLGTRIQRRARAAAMRDLVPLDADATATLERSVDHALGAGDVWEPYMALPTGSDENEERRAVSAALSRLGRRLALDDVDGVGVVAALTLTPM
ncbi:MAG: hypothetical protein PSX37_13945 [bacterium]|nr:hypothetical protein [bacterium]